MRYAVHIGLNQVNPQAYNGWDGELTGAVNDANIMEKLIGAAARVKLLNANATIKNVKSAVKDFVTQAIRDYSMTGITNELYITYSGHGAQVPDRNHDEVDGHDETWCLYDGMITDDAIRLMLTQFITHEKIKIYIFSDSCHSGTIAKVAFGLASDLEPYKRPKMMPANISHEGITVITDRNVSSIRRLTNSTGVNIMTLSGCQDAEVSYDLGEHGAFTQAIMKCEKPGMTYMELLVAVRDALKGMQTPKLTYSGGRSIIYRNIF
ncbi:MAG: caspase family protein [Saprospiraceae bacterium]|nr:caspase family protein [Saprospiraceae bacterium]HMW39901.1 caspase family protein [Saprospiraceae bacterium]HMX89134.1 caspase family protein [Saprospiraceae bacterium]HMZ40805.1 caspase family protein [Saprospiraceae bacterium]HNA64585.1 caspase family protein [Saprospiraceae bacterium]